MADASTDKNKHVEDYLSYYVGLAHPPKYAVLINGPWGVGKTYLIKNFLQRTFKPTADEPQHKVVYVSLYGLSSVAEVDTALLQAIYPMLGKKVTKLGARITQTLLRYKGISADFDLVEKH